jgi:hypothetical protein
MLPVPGRRAVGNRPAGHANRFPAPAPQDLGRIGPADAGPPTMASGEQLRIGVKR